MAAAAAVVAPPAARKVMLVADPTRESAGALQWILSHAVLENDELILFHVEPHILRRNSLSTFLKRGSVMSPGGGGGGGSTNGGGGGATSSTDIGEFLEDMKHKCKGAQPKVKVQIERVDMESGGKADTILLHCNLLKVDMLVIGQKRSLTHAFLRLSGGASSDMAEYLIEHSKCQCVGVQKKGQKAGYLLNSKTHKNFWLLA